MLVTTDIPARSLTTFGTGAPVGKLITVDSEEELLEIDEELFVLGFGSNTLLPDSPPKTLLKLGKNFSGWGIQQFNAKGKLGLKIVAGGSAPLMSLSKLCSKQGLSGLEFAGGIPGSIGGAVKMNAGAHGGEMSGVVSSVRIFNLGSKKFSVLQNQELGFSYRGSSLKDDDIVLSAEIELENSDDAWSIYRENLAYRSRTQPLTQPSFGSVFTNPEPGVYAGELLEKTGLKGSVSGGACFSELHANWIVRTGDEAKTSDALRLIEAGKQAVQDKFGVMLKEEVVIV